MKNFNLKNKSLYETFFICLLILFMLCLLFSCGPTAEEYRKQEQERKQKITNNMLKFDEGAEYYDSVKIGNCWYIKGWAGAMNGGPYLTHKGDCNNPIHVYNNK